MDATVQGVSTLKPPGKNALRFRDHTIKYGGNGGAVSTAVGAGAACVIEDNVRLPHAVAVHDNILRGRAVVRHDLAISVGVVPVGFGTLRSHGEGMGAVQADSITGLEGEKQDEAVTGLQVAAT